ncbi:hypothetical protein GVAV_001200 [Gurleya vavrai]
MTSEIFIFLFVSLKFLFIFGANCINNLTNSSINDILITLKTSILDKNFEFLDLIFQNKQIQKIILEEIKKICTKWNDNDFKKNVKSFFKKKKELKKYFKKNEKIIYNCFENQIIEQEIDMLLINFEIKKENSKSFDFIQKIEDLKCKIDFNCLKNHISDGLNCFLAQNYNFYHQNLLFKFLESKLFKKTDEVKMIGIKYLIEAESIVSNYVRLIYAEKYIEIFSKIIASKSYDINFLASDAYFRSKIPKIDIFDKCTLSQFNNILLYNKKFFNLYKYVTGQFLLTKHQQKVFTEDFVLYFSKKEKIFLENKNICNDENVEIKKYIITQEELITNYKLTTFNQKSFVIFFFNSLFYGLNNTGNHITCEKEKLKSISNQMKYYSNKNAHNYISAYSISNSTCFVNEIKDKCKQFKNNEIQTFCFDSVFTDDVNIKSSDININCLNTLINESLFYCILQQTKFADITEFLETYYLISNLYINLINFKKYNITIQRIIR